MEEERDKHEYRNDTARFLVWIIDLLSYFAESIIRGLGGKIPGRLKQILAPEKWKPDDVKKGPISEEEILLRARKKKSQA